MARFRQVPHHYVLSKLMEYWLNMVRNFRDDVLDEDFFEVLRQNYSHDRAVGLVESAYTKGELGKMEKARQRECRLDLSDSLERVFRALWNNEPTRDFRTVRQEQFYLAGSVTNGERIAALKEECAVKKDGGQTAVIGFAA